MKEYPILFSLPMVQAILEGRKTQTRRIILDSVPDEKMNNQPYAPGDLLFVRENWKLVGWDFEDQEAKLEYGDGTRLELDPGEYYDYNFFDWLNNQITKLEKKGILTSTLTGLDENDEVDDSDDVRYEFTDKKHPLSPSIHLPKWGSRIWLRVKEIRVERLQDISQEDAEAEGMTPAPHRCPGWKNPSSWTRDCLICPFRFLWNQLNGPRGYGWDKNPRVRVTTFEVLSTTGKPSL